MRALLLVLLMLALAGCATSGVHEVRVPEQRGVAVMLTNDRGATVIHPVEVGHEFLLRVGRRWIDVVVVKVGRFGVLEFVGRDEPLDLRPGDSGSPVAVLVGKRR